MASSRQLRRRPSKVGSFFRAALTFALSAFTVAPSAWAQTEDPAAARALFEEGRRLAESNDYDGACAKFEAARKLYTSVGVLLNLADCYERSGRIASAWATFGEAASAADRVGRTYGATEARRRQADIEPRLSHLAIRVLHEEPGLTIQRDGIEVPPPAWNQAVAVDPGPHEIRAEAAGYDPWTTSIRVSAEDLTQTVDVPELPRSETTQRATHAESKPTPAGLTADGHVAEPAVMQPAPSGQRVAGALGGGAGVATMLVGGILGLVAKGHDSVAEREGGRTGQTDSASAVRLGNTATAVVVIGAAAGAAGGVLWLTAPTAWLRVGTSGRDLMLRGTF
jgi:hypothetical protein